jgi:hypothetical protein
MMTRMDVLRVLPAVREGGYGIRGARRRWPCWLVRGVVLVGGVMGVVAWGWALGRSLFSEIW